MKLSGLILFLTGVLMCAPTLSSDDRTMATQAAKDAVEEGNADDVICRRERVLGSHMKKKICMTREQWDVRSTAAQEAADQMMRKGGQKALDPGALESF